MVHKQYHFPKNKNTFSQTDLVNQVNSLNKLYKENCTIELKKNKITGFIYLRPTRHSIQYKVRLECKVGDKLISVFVEEPMIRHQDEKGKFIPHTFKDGSLCLYYPEYKEYDKTMLWAKTIIPWTCLWLFYYETWLETDKWEGGGIHAS